jgi:hypothetical protein
MTNVLYNRGKGIAAIDTHYRSVRAFHLFDNNGSQGDVDDSQYEKHGATKVVRDTLQELQYHTTDQQSKEVAIRH